MCIKALCLCKNFAMLFCLPGESSGQVEILDKKPMQGCYPPIGRELWYHYLMAYIRKFKTTSGATGVQVCYKEGNRVVKTIHVGSASSEKSLARLIKEAQGIIDSNKGETLFSLKRYDR